MSIWRVDRAETAVDEELKLTKGEDLDCSFETWMRCLH
jgi:hypothetical protein